MFKFALGNVNGYGYAGMGALILYARTRASNKYNAKAYDRLNIVVPKGERERIKEYAASKGESLNSYVYKLITADMDK